MELAPEWQPRGSRSKALVRSGVSYVTAARRAESALTELREDIIAARAAGMTVTEIADATGLSRPAVYRALRGKD